MTFKWFISWILVFPLLKLLTGIKINGSVPKKGSFIIACNHVSFFDPPIVGICAAREIHFLAKIDLFENLKVFARLIKAYNAIPISGYSGFENSDEITEKGCGSRYFPRGYEVKKRTYATV
jgi:1-acyl-sn-glycerol-3-phosphate acyltransferase